MKTRPLCITEGSELSAILRRKHGSHLNGEKEAGKLLSIQLTEHQCIPLELQKRIRFNPRFLMCASSNLEHLLLPWGNTENEQFKYPETQSCSSPVLVHELATSSSKGRIEAKNSIYLHVYMYVLVQNGVQPRHLYTYKYDWRT